MDVVDEDVVDVVLEDGGFAVGWKRRVVSFKFTIGFFAGGFPVAGYPNGACMSRVPVGARGGDVLLDGWEVSPREDVE